MKFDFDYELKEWNYPIISTKKIQCFCCDKEIELDSKKTPKKGKGFYISKDTISVAFEYISAGDYFEKKENDDFLISLSLKCFCSNSCANLQLLNLLHELEKKEIKKHWDSTKKAHEETKNKIDESSKDRQKEISLAEIGRNKEIIISFIKTSGIVATIIFTTPNVMNVILKWLA